MRDTVYSVVFPKTSLSLFGQLLSTATRKKNYHLQHKCFVTTAIFILLLLFRFGKVENKVQYYVILLRKV